MRLRHIFYPLIFLLFLLFSTKTTLAGVLPYKVVFNKDKLAKSTKTAEDRNVYQALKIHGIYGTVEQEGVPELPVEYVRLIIPADEDAYDITITSVQKEEIKLDYPVYPVQPDIPTKIGIEQPDFVAPNPDIYKSDNLFPNNPVQIVRDGYFDGNNHILTLAVYPMQYNPVTGLAVFYNALEFNIELKSNSHSTILPVIRSGKNQKMYDAALNSMVDNSGDIDKYQVKPSLSFSKQSSVTSGPVPFYEYVVITSKSLKNSFDKFVRWKKHKGLDIGIVTVEEILAEYDTDNISGITDDAGAIRQYLYDAYMSGTVWVLMGGDYTVVPIRYGCGTSSETWDCPSPFIEDAYKMPADLYFADFTGDWQVDGGSIYWTTKSHLR